jgi:Tfp pilus assembly protein PilP
MRFVKSLELGLLLAAAAHGLHAQAKPANGTPPTTGAASAKPAAQAPAKPAAPGAANQAKPATTAPAKASKQTASKPGTAKPKAKKPSAKAAKPTTSATKESPEKETRVARRDPFESMVGHTGPGGGTPTGPMPPGKAGLQVSTLRLDGIVRAPSGMIAVVSNPQSRTYFLREGDQLYDGRVEKIAMDGVSFHEVGKDAFGKPVERQVNKRIYASAGEQQ